MPVPDHTSRENNRERRFAGDIHFKDCHINKHSARPALIPILILAATLSCWTVPGHALSYRVEDLGELECTVYAPDWTWQNRDINILVVLENHSDSPTEAVLTLGFPPGKEDHFEYPGETCAVLKVPPGSTVRHAFTNIRALAGVPRQTYPFRLLVEHAGRTSEVPYPMQTIRGAVVSPGKWALILPVGLALLWCIVFAAAMSRLAQPRAWRTSADPATLPEASASWINQEPN